MILLVVTKEARGSLGWQQKSLVRSLIMQKVYWVKCKQFEAVLKAPYETTMPRVTQAFISISTNCSLLREDYE